jgi:hypothetical protein
MDYICTSVNANSLAHAQPYFLINEKSLKVYMYTSGKDVKVQALIYDRNYGKIIYGLHLYLSEC